jgi:hypothetical protein
MRRLRRWRLSSQRGGERGRNQKAAQLALAERGARQRRGGVTGRDLRSSVPGHAATGQRPALPWPRCLLPASQGASWAGQASQGRGEAGRQARGGAGFREVRGGGAALASRAIGGRRQLNHFPRGGPGKPGSQRRRRRQEGRQPVTVGPILRTRAMARTMSLVVARMTMAREPLSRRCVLGFWHIGRPTRGSAGTINVPAPQGNII